MTLNIVDISSVIISAHEDSKLIGLDLRFIVNNFISCILYSLTSMLNLEMPHLNCFSKYKLCASSLYHGIGDELAGDKGALDRGHERMYNHEVKDLILQLENAPNLPELFAKYFPTIEDSDKNHNFNKLNRQLLELFDSYDLLSFLTYDVQDSSLMSRLLYHCDKTLGFYATSNDSFELSQFKHYSID
ncbi:MAG: hypothetical protein MHMPM18_001677 [Marteilia pararefringens]